MFIWKPAYFFVCSSVLNEFISFMVCWHGALLTLTMDVLFVTCSWCLLPCPLQVSAVLPTPRTGHRGGLSVPIGPQRRGTADYPWSYPLTTSPFIRSVTPAYKRRRGCHSGPWYESQTWGQEQSIHPCFSKKTPFWHPLILVATGC